MERNIKEAVALYSGNKPLALFVERLEYNLEKMNEVFEDISHLFKLAGVPDFSRLPDDPDERSKFTKLFNEFNGYLEAAKIQGFVWSKAEYSFEEAGKEVKMKFDENTYLILALRYKELLKGGGIDPPEDVPFDIDGHLIAIDTGKIDTNYMNSRFEKYLKELHQGEVDPETLDELHKSFATLTQEEQKYANIFIHDVQSGDADLEDGKTFRDYITEYQYRAKSEQNRKLAEALGVDIFKLENLLQAHPSEGNLNEYGRFDDLKRTVVLDRASAYFVSTEGKAVSDFQLSIKIEKLLKDFILSGGFDIVEEGDDPSSPYDA